MSIDLAGDLLSGVADRLQLPGDRAPIHAVLARACGGQLDARLPDGQRASTLTAAGTPLELSVTGGGGKVTSAVRYATEAKTQVTTFADRVAAQLTAIEDLVTWLPNGDETTVGMLQSFVSTLYPDPTNIPKRFRSPTWFGVVHHRTVPQHIAGLKVYAGLRAAPGALDRLRNTMPGFADLDSIPDADDEFFVPVGAGLEVDANGHVNHKIYVKTRRLDPAVPMKLVQHFGDPAWEALCEFVRCGLDATMLHRHRFVICCARGDGPPALGVHLMMRPREDSTELVDELARRHHGSGRAVEAMVRAAESCGATWSYSAVALSVSGESGINKLNVYGVPHWATTLTEQRYEGRRQQPARSDASPETSQAGGSASVRRGAGSTTAVTRATHAAISGWGGCTYPRLGFRPWADEHDEVAPVLGQVRPAVGDDATADRIRQCCVARYDDPGGRLRFRWQWESYAAAHNLSFLSHTTRIPSRIVAVEQERSESSVDEVASGDDMKEGTCADVAHRLMGAAGWRIPGLVDLSGRDLLNRRGSDGESGFLVRDGGTEDPLPARTGVRRSLSADECRSVRLGLVGGSDEVRTAHRSRGGTAGVQ